jgi:hypothetical protein
MTESDTEAIHLDDGGSKTGLIAGVVAAGSLIFGLGIGHVVSWESLFNFTFGSVLMLPLTEAMLSVRLYLFIIYRLLHSAFTTSLVFGRLFTATLMEVRPFIKINPLRKLIVEPP